MRSIQPLGDQLIIRTIPVSTIGSIVVPDSAKGITVMNPNKPTEAVHFVEAEVLAVGPGKRMKGDKHLVSDLAHGLQLAYAGQMSNADIDKLFQRAENGHHRVPLSVKPKDKILYHPSVQKFDRDITDFLSDGTEPAGTRYYLISEETSVLAVIEREPTHA